MLPGGIILSFVEVDTTSAENFGVKADCYSGCVSSATGQDSVVSKGIPPPGAADVVRVLDTTARHFSCQENVHALLQLVCQIQ